MKLGDEYAAWFASAENSLADRASLMESGHLRIVSPAPGTTFIIDPDLPSSRHVRLVAAGSANAQWQSEFASVVEDGIAQLAEGEHHLSVIDPTTGAHAETWIRVKTL